MSDEKTAETLADDTTTAAPADDGIIDLDAQPEVKNEPAEEDDKGETKLEGKEEPEGEDKPKKPSGAQRAKIREQRLLSELQQREREIEELRRAAPAKASEGDEKPPKEEDFNGDWFAYQTAKSAFEGRQAIRDELRKDRETREASEREAKQAEVIRERNIAHSERVEDAREVIADFDQTMEAMKGVNVRNDVLEEIMSSEKSALIAYHLAKNPSELNALNSMSGRELARAMGRLEATVRMPEAKKATSAPPPLSKPKGGATPQSQEGILDAWLKKKYG